MGLQERLNEVVVSVIDNKNGTSTVIYKGKESRIEHMPTKEALLLAKRCNEEEAKKNKFEKENGHLYGKDEILRRTANEAETFKQIRRKLASN